MNPHECESLVIEQYDEDFAALYRCVWDSYLGDRQEALLRELFPNGSFPDKVLDAAAGTGELAVRLAKSGRRVMANELSPSMRSYIHTQKAANALADSTLSILEPGSCWRHLPTMIGKQSFGLVVCIGSALAHCDNSPDGILRDSLVGLASLVQAGGFLLIDCKRYAEDGCELQGDGTKRPLEVTDLEAVAWRDRNGIQRQGTLRSSFSTVPDRSLKRVFHYEPCDSGAEGERDWIFRTWPVEKHEVCQIVSSCGMHLVKEKVLGGTGKKVLVDNLLFRKESPR